MSAPADGRPAGRVREVFPAEGQEGRDQAQADEGKAETARQGEQSSVVNISTGVARKFSRRCQGHGWVGGGRIGSGLPGEGTLSTCESYRKKLITSVM